MDLAMYLEVAMFFLMSTIVIGGALGLVYMQRVAHSMMCLIFWFYGSGRNLHPDGCRIPRSHSDSSLSGQRHVGCSIRYYAD